MSHFPSGPSVSFASISFETYIGLLLAVLKVIIAGAGGAAHLPGMVAALCPLPVIGVSNILKVHISYR